MGNFFSSLSKSATETGLNLSELLLLIFGASLVFGMLGEYERLPGGLIQLIQKRRFVALVILGVSGELFADAGVWLFSGQLQIITEREIAPRTLTLDQQRKIGMDLQRFAGNHVVLGSYIQDLEG